MAKKPCDCDSGKMTFQQWAAAGGAVPMSYRGREKAWANQVKKYAAGGEAKMQAGGIAKLAKLLKGTQETLPAAQREANLQKMLEPSKVQQRLYHGTMASEGGKRQEAIRRIKPSKEGALGSGVYLTPQSEFASTYAGFPARSQLERDIETGSDFAKKSARQLIDRMDRGAVEPHEVGGNMLPVYAQIKNPLMLEGKGDPMIEALVKLGVDEATAGKMVERAYERKGYIGKEVENRARAAGYDGLMQYRDGNLSEVVSYNPGAVKSAIGNKGTYDTSKPDLNEAKGGAVHMADGGKVDKPYIGYRRAGRRPESQQDRAASANIPVAVARGLVSGTLGMPGDLESLARLPYELITGKESPTILPTSGDIEKRLPFRGASQTPVGQMFTGASQLVGGAYTGPGSGARAVMAVPKAVMQAGRDFVGAAGQGVSPLTVYHGSPHKFDKFDASKIGTGEGAQAYGHGLYFAESPGVAKSYQPRSPKFEEKLIGLYQKASSSRDFPMMEVLEDAMLHRTPSELIQKFANAEDGYTKQHAKAAQDFAKWYSKNEPEVGGLYTVDLPDEKIARMLDWDKPLSEQPEVIKALKGTDYEVGMSQRQAEKVADQRLREEADEWAEMTGGDPVDYSNNVDWESYVDQVRKESGSIDSSITGEKLHGMIMRDEGYRPDLFDTENYQVGTSEALRGYGIPGVKYLDRQSRQAGEGSRNFVVFPGEEDALTILERKKAGGEVKMAGGGAVKDALKKLLSSSGAAKEATAAERAAAGRMAADVTKATEPMKMSEALGNLNVEGKGKVKVSQSDRTKVGGGNIGGAMFPGLSQVDPLYEGLVWGVGKKSTGSSLINQSDDLTYWSTLLGSEDQLKTNPIVFNKLRREFVNAMKQGKLSSELEGNINKNLALTFGEGADIRDPKIWQRADTFDKRAALADVMLGQGIPPGKGGVALGGEKSGKGVIFKPTDILKRETEPLLLHPEHGGNVPTFAVGPRLFQLSGGMKVRPDLHPGFPVLLEGQDMGMVFKPAPGEIAMRDFYNRINAERGRKPGYYEWTMGESGKGLPSQDITDEYLTYLQKAGYKKGGKVGGLSQAKNQRKN